MTMYCSYTQTNSSSLPPSKSPRLNLSPPRRNLGFSTLSLSLSLSFFLDDGTSSLISKHKKRSSDSTCGVLRPSGGRRGPPPKQSLRGPRVRHVSDRHTNRLPALHPYSARLHSNRRKIDRLTVGQHLLSSRSGQTIPITER